MKYTMQIAVACAVVCLMSFAPMAHAAKTETARTHTETYRDRSPHVHVRGAHPRS
ncbi:MAG: hypothetical protein ABR910_15840 [Acidobacteriaceae bacterium]|jgi:hypothetical protein